MSDIISLSAIGSFAFIGRGLARRLNVKPGWRRSIPAERRQNPGRRRAARERHLA